MKLILSHSASLGWRLLAEVLIVLAVLLTLSRMVLPFANEFSDVIAEQVENIINHPVSLGNVEAGWAGIKPLIKLENVTIGDQELGKPLATFDHIRLKIDLWSSLVERRVVPESLILRGSQIEVVRTQDGQILFRGFEMARANKQSNPTGSLHKLAGVSLNLRDIHLLWTDEVLKQKFEFDAEQLELLTTANSLSIDSQINLPQSIGEKLRLVANIQGPLDNMIAWKTEIYIKGESIDVQGIPFPLPKPLPKISSGEVNLEIWGDWKNETGLLAVGQLEAHDLRFEGKAGSGVEGRYEFVDQISSTLKLTGELNNWQLDMDQLDIVTGRRHWPSNGLSVAYKGAEYEADNEIIQESHWSGHVDLIDSGELLRLVSLSPMYTGNWSELLLKTNPQGELVDFGFQTVSENAQLKEFYLAAEVEDFSWQGEKHIPGASAVSGSFSLDERGGDAVIHSAILDYDNRKLFEHTISLDSLQGDIAWHTSAENKWFLLDNLKIANQDFSSSGTVQLEFPEKGRPRLDVEMIVPHIDAKTASRYIPYPTLRNPKTRYWLKNALLGGTARNALFNYHGELSKKAFRAKTAKMDASFDVDKGKLHYQDNWPNAYDLTGRVSFSNARLHADISKGKILDAVISPVSVDIENLFLSRLEIDGFARGDVSTMLSYLRHTLIAREMTPFLEKVVSKGDANLDLTLKIPLSRKLKPRETVQVNGEFSMKDGMLSLPENDLRFDHVSGALNFKNKKYWAKELTAEFRGGSLNGHIRTDEDLNIHIFSAGKFPASALLPKIKDQLDVVVSGVSEWQSRFTIPSKSNRNNGDRLSLKVSSDLLGTRILLPDEFAKAEDITRPININYKLGAIPNLRLWLGKRIFIDADFDSGAKFALSRGVLSLATETAVKKPDSGFTIAGKWPVLALQPWLELVQKLKTSDTESNFSINKIDLETDRFFLSEDLFLNNSKLIGKKANDRWQFNVHSKEASGKVDIPANWGPKERIYAQLDYFNWQQERKSTKSKSVSPAGFPGIDATIQSTSIGKRQFGKVTLNTSPSAVGLNIDSLKFGKEAYQGELGGTWIHQAGQAKSDISLKMRTSNTGAMLQDLGFNSGMSSGVGEITGTVSWPGAPFSPDLEQTSGDLQISVVSGKLDNVEPGLGRLISLVSLNNLPRRLALNFKDLSEEGLYFDHFTGNIDMLNGLLKMEDLRIDSPLVNVDITGTTSLIDQQHNLALEVTPKIKSSIPVAAGILAGPQTGALVFLVDKFAESMGVDFNKTAVRNFHVSGSWDDPVVDAVQLEVETLETDTETQFFGEELSESD